MTLSLSPNTAAPSSVIEVTAQNFMQEVMQASLKMPVLLYFTASWCGPCKQFGPLLEKVVNDTKGRVKLAKVDVDKNPQIAQQFRIQSVPMVYIIMQGQPLDAFSGAVPESQLKQLLSQLMGASPEEEAAAATLEDAKLMLAEGRAEEALPVLIALNGQDPANMDVTAAILGAYIALGKLEDAEAIITRLPDEAAKHEGIVSAKAALALAKNAPSRDQLLQLNDRLAKDPKDHQARFELSAALYAGGKQEAAIDELLHIIARDKQWNEGAARAQLLTYFEALGHTNPLTMQGRRKLSSILFS